MPVSVHVQDAMPVSGHEIFLSRIRIILDWRDRYPWGALVGMTRGTINRIFNEGQIPTGETLSAIGRVENCALSWLLNGQGSPYIVGRCENDEECAERLDELLEEKGWTIHLLTDGERYALVLTQPAIFFIKERPVEYTACETLAGPIGEETLQTIQRSGHHAFTVTLPAEQITRLIAGQLGTYALLAKDGGLLRDEHPLAADTRMTAYSGAADERAGYNDTERQLLKAWRKLDGTLKNAALAAVEAMGKK